MLRASSLTGLRKLLAIADTITPRVSAHARAGRVMTASRRKYVHGLTTVSSLSNASADTVVHYGRIPSIIATRNKNSCPFNAARVFVRFARERYLLVA